MARPTKMTNCVIGKLEEAFALGCTDAEACFYADIHPDTLYDYCKKNPQFSERKSLLKLKPVLKAKKTILENLNDAKVAQWYLERKCKEEFNTKIEQKPLIDFPASALKIEIIGNQVNESKGNDEVLS